VQLVARLDAALRRRLELVEEALHIAVILGQHGDRVHVVGRSDPQRGTGDRASVPCGWADGRNGPRRRIAVA
jgi:hypothetical protein